MADDQTFFDNPILNSPYEAPCRHWELDEDNCPTDRVVEHRRPVTLITPIPSPVGQRQTQREFVFSEEAARLEEDHQQYDLTTTIAAMRARIEEWRAIRDPRKWGVTHETERLLSHWRGHEFNDFRPFFCQVEAAETVIWLSEVASKNRKQERGFLESIDSANQGPNALLSRVALKLATGTGKTTVMAMLIAWQTINAVRHPQSDRFTKGFLIVTPGITVRDRLRVLQPNDPDSYYERRELVPRDMLADLSRAKIVITNFHAFKRRDRSNLSAPARNVLEGRDGSLDLMESEGQMVRRVMAPLMGMKRIWVFNDEAHHCYRERPPLVSTDVAGADGEEETIEEEEVDVEKAKESARLWISGLEAVQKCIGLSKVIDLSATPFFLKGSGYSEGTLFPWTVYDFSLMDAIECGIVKLPRIPVSDNLTSSKNPQPRKTDRPMYRYLWEHIGSDLPSVGRRQMRNLDPQSLPVKLKTALELLYGGYEEVFSVWEKANAEVPPCFVIICNSTATSKMVYDYIAGYRHIGTDGTEEFTNGRLSLFRNYDDDGKPFSRPRTLLVDSEQLESGESFDSTFRAVAQPEIDRFRREMSLRTGNPLNADDVTDEQLLREVMNTVGKPRRLGDSVRCVVSVSMITEGWDANTVTHILGVRAFGTQLLCEQAIGRALRRYSYELDENQFFDVEYADIFGIPFDFTAKPVIKKPPKPPGKKAHVHAVSPGRDSKEIIFPRVIGYRVELPADLLDVDFDQNATLTLTPRLVGATKARNEGIVGAGVNLETKDLQSYRELTVIYHLTRWLLTTRWVDCENVPKFQLFGQLRKIVGRWIREHLVCQGGTTPGFLLYQQLANMACEHIARGIISRKTGEKQVVAVVDPLRELGSTRCVDFWTTKQLLWSTDEDQCHVNYAVCDSSWEDQFCQILEAHPRVICYVKNNGLEFEVPYRFGTATRRYFPDFIALIDDGSSTQGPLHLVVEVKGYRRENVADKHDTMMSYWIPGVNSLKVFGRWDFVEFNNATHMEEEFNSTVARYLAHGSSNSGPLVSLP